MKGILGLCSAIRPYHVRSSPVWLCLWAFLQSARAQAPAEMSIVGDWEVSVKAPTSQGAAIEARLHVAPPAVLAIAAEEYDSLPVFNPGAGGWIKGAQLHAVQAQETTTPFLLEPNSLKLRSGPEPASQLFIEGTDYLADQTWGTFGRKEGGRITASTPVYAWYTYSPLRLDSVVLTAEALIVLRQGQARAAAPKPPPLRPGEKLLGNIWIPGRIPKLAPSHLFPILEHRYPEPARLSPTAAERFLPKTMAKLRAGEPLRILAWGDSVTVGTYVPDPDRERWQAQFVLRLRARFPTAKIELVTEAWGGRNTGSYLAEPPGSPHNYREKVLDRKPDLVVSEFVNDAGLNVEQVDQHYRRFLDDFRGIGAEWIILTPHYVRPDWMGIDRERDVDDDPRPYVAGLRKFGEKHSVAVADAARRYGRLWRQGLPYTTLMLNSINHPDAVGMAIFADALMELFP